jgi:flagellar protein FlbD
MISPSNADKGPPELYPRRKGIVLIQLTRLNGNPIALNSDLIKFVENAPDTVITLLNGEKIIVRETSDDVIHRIVDFRRSVMAGLPSWSGSDVNSAILRPQDPHPTRSPEDFRRG